MVRLIQFDTEFQCISKPVLWFSVDIFERFFEEVCLKRFSIVSSIRVEIETNLMVLLPHWPSGCKCDCWARSFGIDSRVGRNITGLFSVFRKLTIYYTTYIVKNGCTLYSGIMYHNLHLFQPPRRLKA
ncbi:hypothetical protein SFRURICE_016288 [Spodoptera frugiperda]|nr:hypothetical protein SFRURICE_016288 [Spodoptera frugiperda]